MNIEKIPNHVLEALRERMYDGEIKCSTPEKLFVEYCEYQGLRGWGYPLISILRDLEDAKKDA